MRRLVLGVALAIVACAPAPAPVIAPPASSISAPSSGAGPSSVFAVPASSDATPLASPPPTTPTDPPPAKCPEDMPQIGRACCPKGTNAMHDAHHCCPYGKVVWPTNGKSGGGEGKCTAPVQPQPLP